MVILVFITIHQKTLQKNFVAMKKAWSKPAIVSKDDWPDSLVSSILAAMSNNIEMRCIIEGKDLLEGWVDHGILTGTPLTRELTDLIAGSSEFSSNNILRVDTLGTLISINSKWKIEVDDVWVSGELAGSPDWKQNAISCTTHTDALFLKSNPQSRTITAIASGTVKEDLTALQAAKIIKQKFGLDITKNDKKQTKGITNVHRSTEANPPEHSA